MNREHIALKFYPPTAPYESETHQFVLQQMRNNLRPKQTTANTIHTTPAYETTLADLASTDDAEIRALQVELLQAREQLVAELATTSAKLLAVTDTLNKRPASPAN